MSFPFRAEALERDDHACVNCGAPASDVHHIVPRSRGGLDVLGNLASLCLTCHGLVHGATMARLSSEARQRARSEGVVWGRKKSYTAEQADQVRLLLGRGVSQRAAARMLGLSATTVRRALADDAPAQAVPVTPTQPDTEPDWLDLELARLRDQAAQAS